MTNKLKFPPPELQRAQSARLLLPIYRTYARHSVNLHPSCSSALGRYA